MPRLRGKYAGNACRLLHCLCGFRHVALRNFECQAHGEYESLSQFVTEVPPGCCERKLWQKIPAAIETFRESVPLSMGILSLTGHC